MSIFKRGNVYWYHFIFNGEHVLLRALNQFVGMGISTANNNTHIQVRHVHVHL